MLPEPLKVTILITTILEKLEIPYLICGSIASTFYGNVRTTLDSDILVKMKGEQVDQFVTQLSQQFYIDNEMVAGAFTRRSSFNIIHRETFFKVDIFFSNNNEFDENQFLRANRIVLVNEPAIEAFVASPEDTVLAKLDWYRVGGEISERQWQDVIGILKVQSDRLDYAYMEKWADKLGLHDLYQRIIGESSTHPA